MEISGEKPRFKEKSAIITQLSIHMDFRKVIESESYWFCVDLCGFFAPGCADAGIRLNRRLTLICKTDLAYRELSILIYKEYFRSQIFS
jgi:hypothetical protein